MICVKQTGVDLYATHIIKVVKFKLEGCIAATLTIHIGMRIGRISHYCRKFRVVACIINRSAAFKAYAFSSGNRRAGKQVFGFKAGRVTAPKLYFLRASRSLGKRRVGYKRNVLDRTVYGESNRFAHAHKFAYKVNAAIKCINFVGSVNIIVSTQIFGVTVKNDAARETALG